MGRAFLRASQSAEENARTGKHLGGQMPGDDGDRGENAGRLAASESLFYRLHTTYFVSRAAANLLPFTPLMRLLCTLVESTYGVASHFRSISRHSTDERACLRARTVCMTTSSTIHPLTGAVDECTDRLRTVYIHRALLSGWYRCNCLGFRYR